MYQRILVPVDGSDTSQEALAAALALARELSARVRVIHAFDDMAFIWGYEFDAAALQAARDHISTSLDKAASEAAAAGVAVETALLDAPGRRLGEVVAQDATNWKADLIVVGSHGRRGISRAVLGSGAEQVIRLAPVPVLVIRGRPGAASAS